MSSTGAPPFLVITSRLLAQLFQVKASMACGQKSCVGNVTTHGPEQPNQKQVTCKSPEILEGGARQGGQSAWTCHLGKDLLPSSAPCPRSVWPFHRAPSPHNTLPPVPSHRHTPHGCDLSHLPSVQLSGFTLTPPLDTLGVVFMCLCFPQTSHKCVKVTARSVEWSWTGFILPEVTCSPVVEPLLG